jgi:hypothetical protein
MQTTNQNAVFATGPEYTLITMLEPEPAPELDPTEIELYERNTAGLDNFFGKVVPSRDKYWKRKLAWSRKCLKKWKPRVDAMETRLEENQPV